LQPAKKILIGGGWGCFGAGGFRNVLGFRERGGPRIAVAGCRFDPFGVASSIPAAGGVEGKGKGGAYFFRSSGLSWFGVRIFLSIF